MKLDGKSEQSPTANPLRKFFIFKVLSTEKKPLLFWAYGWRQALKQKTHTPDLIVRIGQASAAGQLEGISLCLEGCHLCPDTPSQPLGGGGRGGGGVLTGCGFRTLFQLRLDVATE